MPEFKKPERRQYKRIKKNFIVRYFELDNPDVRYEASQLKNFSLGGMCLITPKAFEPSCRLVVEFKTPFQTETIPLGGVVLESHERIKGIIYETRIKFSAMGHEAEGVLKKIIDHFEKEEGQE